MKAPSEEIYSKSTICDFLLMVNSKRGRITLLNVCEIFSRLPLRQLGYLVTVVVYVYRQFISAAPVSNVDCSTRLARCRLLNTV